MNALIRKIAKRILILSYWPVWCELSEMRHQLDATRTLVGQLQAARVNALPQITSLRDIEFSVYSSAGEDGIIEYLISKVNIQNHVFVEFGVEKYTESNTRFLLKNRNWRGLVLDANQQNIDYIRQDDIYWKYDLEAVCAFITAENINELIRGSGIEGDIGLLSIDIDGNDYWVWKAIEVANPRIVVCEFNSVFGVKHAITIPYDPGFVRTRAHHSNLYFGASLLALYELGLEKGYQFVGCNSVGTNAFFVRQDCAGNVRSVAAEEGYVVSKLRESRDKQGELTFARGKNRCRAISRVQVYDLHAKRLRKIKELGQL